MAQTIEDQKVLSEKTGIKSNLENNAISQENITGDKIKKRGRETTLLTNLQHVK